MIKGDKINFQSCDHIDYTVYSTWINNFEHNKFLVSARFPQSESDLREYVASYDNQSKVLFSIFGENQYIGNIVFSSIDWLNRRAEVGLFIGCTGSRGKGYGFDALHTMCAYGFEQLNLFKITAGIFEGNGASMKLFKKAGFVQEAEFKDHYYIDSKYVSEFRFALFNKAFIKK